MDIATRNIEWTNDVSLRMPVALPDRRGRVECVYETALGALYWSSVEDFLKSEFAQARMGDAQLVFTSPPFPLHREKKYGNLKGDEYIEWIGSLAQPLRDLLRPDGSIVMEIGNVWEPGRPVMSTVVLQALLQFLQRGGLSLCQEFVWYNPARLPSPTQWVNIERIRVKDAFSRIWWMAPTDRPKANNRRVLKAYSAAMKRLLEKKAYNAGVRPSAHRVGPTAFLQDNSGAIPPSVLGADDLLPLSNLLKVSNTRSSDSYQSLCRSGGLEMHPARMPADIVEFFVKFLTEEADLVFDPFAGSNTTGAVAESLGRRWLGTEANWNYAISSVGRFSPEKVLRMTTLVQTRGQQQGAA